MLGKNKGLPPLARESRKALLEYDAEAAAAERG